MELKVLLYSKLSDGTMTSYRRGLTMYTVNGIYQATVGRKLLCYNSFWAYKLHVIVLL